MSEGGPQPGQDGPSSAEASWVTAAAPTESQSDGGKEYLGPAALEFLNGLLDNIRTMLAYVNSAGIAVPDELRSKLDELMNNPALDQYYKRTVTPSASWIRRFSLGRSKGG
jgi:hypothetical protein